MPCVAAVLRRCAPETAEIAPHRERCTAGSSVCAVNACICPSALGQVESRSWAHATLVQIGLGSAVFRTMPGTPDAPALAPLKVYCYISRSTLRSPASACPCHAPPILRGPLPPVSMCPLFVCSHRQPCGMLSLVAKNWLLRRMLMPRRQVGRGPKGGELRTEPLKLGCTC